MDALERPVDLSYEPFSRSEEYVAANRALVDRIDAHEVRVVVDLACGTGTLTDLLLGRLTATGAARASDTRVVGIDLSRESLDLAHGFLTGRWPEVRLELVEASADRIPEPSSSVDVVAIGNAIHLFDDKEALVREVARVLRPDGVFAFDTSFYAGTFPPGTDRLYLDWVREALRVAHDLAGPPRRAGRRAFSVPWLSPDDYGRVASDAGLRVEHQVETVVRLTARNLEDVGAYSGLATVLLPGYDGPVASEALVRAARPVFERAGLAAVPRNWLHVVAVAP